LDFGVIHQPLDGKSPAQNGETEGKSFKYSRVACRAAAQNVTRCQGQQATASAPVYTGKEILSRRLQELTML
jgi:hypothetical protein